jgi:uncharacterized protein DUF6220
MNWARAAHRVLAALIAAGVAVQFFLAGAGAFGATGYGSHRALGWALLIAALVELLVAVAAATLIRHTGTLALVVGMQVLLGVLGSETQPWFGAFHALNAVAVMAVAGTLARAAWLAQ